MNPEPESVAMGTKDVCLSLGKVLSFSILLAQDLCALFWQDDKFNDASIFWVFYAFSVASAFLEICASFNDYLLLCFIIIVEVVQGVLFMWLCGWADIAVIVMAIAAGFDSPMFVRDPVLRVRGTTTSVTI
jgi:hypothetical protein